MSKEFVANDDSDEDMEGSQSDDIQAGSNIYTWKRRNMGEPPPI